MLVKWVDVWMWVSLGGVRSAVVTVAWHGEQSVDLCQCLPMRHLSSQQADVAAAQGRQRHELALQGKNGRTAG